MGKNEQFHQYGYDHYLKAPKKPRQKGYKSKLSGSSFLHKLQSPAVASVALLAAAVMFTGVVIATYPSDKKAERPIPIVQADLSPMKRAPVERGGMDIPNSQSTILSRSEPAGVENLLSRSKSVPLVMKDDAIEMAMSQPKDEYFDAPPVGVGNEQDLSTSLEQVETVSELKEPPSPVIEVVPSESLDAQAAAQVLQKIGSSEIQEGSKFEQQVALAAVAMKPNYKKMHAPGQSPETLDFVRNVLNSTSADQVAGIEPSAGAASPKAAIAIAPGDYYVQLASIKDNSRAPSEWMKMQKTYNALDGVGYRVQQASLNSGTFYRIQAGPMSKDSADKVCRSLKAANKPGGCLVVK